MPRLHFLLCVAREYGLLERDELHTREGATQTKIGPRFGRFDSSVASGHQLSTGTTQVGLFRSGTFIGRAGRAQECWQGSQFWTFCRSRARGVPGRVTFGRVIGRKYVRRGSSVFGSLAPEAGNCNQTHAFVGVEARGTHLQNRRGHARV